MRFLLVGLLVCVSLAGCADGDDAGAQTAIDGGVDGGSIQLQAGRGAIEGLLVDDRFRPIDLEDNPQTEFQTTGFVLLQETGQQAQTDANGQFAFLDLEPGSYTLRVTADGHEAIPVRVSVVEAVFAEAQVLARRVVSTAGAIITQEFAVFIPCAAYATTDCTGDLSQESYRASFGHSFEGFSDLSYMVTEALMNQDGVYCVEVRESEATGGSTVSEHYGNWCTPTPSGDYVKGINLVGEIYDEVHSRDPYNPAADSQTVLFYFGQSETLCWHEATDRTDKRCVGVGLGIKAQFMISLFLGEPEVDIEAYCILC